MNTYSFTSFFLSLEDNFYSYKLDLNNYSKALSTESINPKRYLKQEMGFNKTLSSESISLIMAELNHYSLENISQSLEEIKTSHKILFGLLYGLAAVVRFILMVLKAIWDGLKKLFDLTFGNLFRLIKETFQKSKESLSQSVIAYLNKPIMTFASFRDNSEGMKNFIFHFLIGKDSRVSYLTTIGALMMDEKRLKFEYSYSVLDFFSRASNKIQEIVEKENRNVDVDLVLNEENSEFNVQFSNEFYNMFKEMPNQDTATFIEEKILSLYDINLRKTKMTIGEMLGLSEDSMSVMDSPYASEFISNSIDDLKREMTLQMKETDAMMKVVAQLHIRLKKLEPKNKELQKTPSSNRKILFEFLKHFAKICEMCNFFMDQRKQMLLDLAYNMSKIALLDR